MYESVLYLKNGGSIPRRGFPSYQEAKESLLELVTLAKGMKVGIELGEVNVMASS